MSINSELLQTSTLWFAFFFLFFFSEAPGSSLLHHAGRSASTCLRADSVHSVGNYKRGLWLRRRVSLLGRVCSSSHLELLCCREEPDNLRDGGSTFLLLSHPDKPTLCFMVSIIPVSELASDTRFFRSLHSVPVGLFIIYSVLSLHNILNSFFFFLLFPRSSASLM